MTTPRAVVLSLLLFLAGCGPRPAACNATNCPAGCCDPQGACRAGNSALLCGTGGLACSVCGAGLVCEANTCRMPGTTDGGTDAGVVSIAVNEVALNSGDFFELINTGTTTANLSGYQVADLDPATSGPKLADALTLPAGTTLTPAGFLLFVEGTTPGPSTACGDAVVSTCFNVGFGLSLGSGDAVFLLDPGGKVVVRADVAPNAHATGRSWGRFPDGTGAFRETGRTPGEPNALPVEVDSGVPDSGTPDAGNPDAGPTTDATTFVVVRVGPAADGGALSNASAAVQLTWYALATGAAVRTVALPSGFTLSGSATSEGLLAHAPSGYWTLAGYGSVPGVAGIASAAAINRVVARIGDDGGTDTSTAFADAYAGNNVRAAATADGTGFWLGGTATASAGVRYAALGATTTTDVFSQVLNIRAVKVFAGQLYASTATDAGAGVARVFAVGTGLPQTASAASPLDGVTVLATGDFVLLGPNTLYVVDTGNGVGVRRFTKSGATWNETSALHTPAGVACIGVAARDPGDGGAPVVLCTGGNGVVYRWDDDGIQSDGGTPAPVPLVTAPAGTVYRGLGF